MVLNVSSNKMTEKSICWYRVRKDLEELFNPNKDPIYEVQLLKLWGSITYHIMSYTTLPNLKIFSDLDNRKQNLEPKATEEKNTLFF